MQFINSHTITIGGVTMARTILDIRRCNTVAGVYKLARATAVDYAKSSATYARSSLTEKYNVTESTYYTLLAMAITHHLVSIETAEKILDKIKVNQKAHGNNGHKSQLKYDLLIEKRKHLSAFTKQDIAHIARYFANHPEQTKAEIARVFSFHKTTPLDYVLYLACVELIISDKVFEDVRKRSITTASDRTKTEKFFAELEARRTLEKQNRKKIKSHSAF